MIPASKWLSLLAFVAICLGVAAIGGLATAHSLGSWYEGLHKPAFNPPQWIFGPVWTVLYLLIAVAGWQVWRRRGLTSVPAALWVYALQLLLNLAWSFLFFGARRIGLALGEVLVLLAVIVLNTVLFWRIDELAGVLLLPYAGWVGFASLLNAAVWRLN